MNEVKSPKKPLLYYYFVVMLLVMLFNFIAMPWISEHQIKDVDYNTFVTMTEQGEVGRVEIQEQSNRILFTSSDEKTVYKTAMVPDDGLVQRLLDAGVSTTGEEIEQTSTLVSILAWVLPIIIFVALGQYMSRKMMEKMGGGGNSMMFNMGKSNAKVYVKSAEGIKFDDVAGEDEAKENLTEVVNYLHDPSKYQEIGASMPKGILLVGPPGTGKTMLAKAVAGEANVPFFSMSGSEFVEMFVGMGASKVRDLFKQAKEKAPCIVFIDEIDAIGRARGKNAGFSGNDERENTLNQLLTEMDGFQTNTGVIVLAATNRADILDKALMRAGRFDRQIEVGLPDVKEREEIFNVHLRNLKLDPHLDRSFLAKQTPGFSGADIANVCNEAALIAARHNKSRIEREDFLAAIDRIYIGCRIGNGFPHDRRGILRGVARREDRSRQLRGRQGCQGDLGEFRIQVLLLPRDSLYLDSIAATGLQSVEAHRRLCYGRLGATVERTGVRHGVLYGVPCHGYRNLRHGVFRQDGDRQSNGIHGFFVIRATCKSGPEDKKS